jgi:hypothetical protein
MIPSIYVNSLQLSGFGFITAGKNEESKIRHKTENELSEVFYTHFFGVNPNNNNND